MKLKIRNILWFIGLLWLAFSFYYLFFVSCNINNPRFNCSTQFSLGDFFVFFNVIASPSWVLFLISLVMRMKENKEWPFGKNLYVSGK